MPFILLKFLKLKNGILGDLISPWRSATTLNVREGCFVVGLQLCCSSIAANFKAPAWDQVESEVRGKDTEHALFCSSDFLWSSSVYKEGSISVREVRSPEFAHFWEWIGCFLHLCSLYAGSTSTLSPNEQFLRSSDWESISLAEPSGNSDKFEQVYIVVWTAGVTIEAGFAVEQIARNYLPDLLHWEVNLWISYCNSLHYRDCFLS